MQVMHHPVHRDFKMPGWPVRVDGKPPAIRSSPILGVHTDAVLTEWLGLNAHAVETLRAEGAV
jgi:crotonobetainyl-CoA:carnitine CoA-transferase CaiB-like acyl-CoA transferase